MLKSDPMVKDHAWSEKQCGWIKAGTHGGRRDGQSFWEGGILHGECAKRRSSRRRSRRRRSPNKKKKPDQALLHKKKEDWIDEVYGVEKAVKPGCRTLACKRESYLGAIRATQAERKRIAPSTDSVYGHGGSAGSKAVYSGPVNPATGIAAIERMEAGLLKRDGA